MGEREVEGPALPALIGSRLTAEDDEQNHGYGECAEPHDDAGRP
jgi:hypothetical protein